MKFLHLTLLKTNNPVAININRITSIYVSTNLVFHKGEKITCVSADGERIAVNEPYEDVLKKIEIKERISEYV